MSSESGNQAALQPIIGLTARPTVGRQIDERDSTQDWLLTEEATPPLLDELIERIEEALDVAYASEAAVGAIGAAAIDAAEQARAAVKQALRAAEQAHRSALLAEQASAAMLEDRRRRTVAGAVPTRTAACAASASAPTGSSPACARSSGCPPRDAESPGPGRGDILRRPRRSRPEQEQWP